MNKWHLLDHPGVIPREQKGIKIALKLCYTPPHCLKITQNVAFEFLNVGNFHQFLSY